MNAAALQPRLLLDLRQRYRTLDVREQELKGEITLAQQNLDGVRELKKEIGQQIFNAVTTSHTNGPTTNCNARP